MSTDYIITKDIPLSEIGRLEKWEGIEVDINPIMNGEKQKNKILFSSKNSDVGDTNYLHGYINPDNTISHVCRYGGNNPERIIQCIEDEFNVECIDEHQHDKWDQVCNEKETV